MPNLGGACYSLYNILSFCEHSFHWWLLSWALLPWFGASFGRFLSKVVFRGRKGLDQRQVIREGVQVQNKSHVWLRMEFWPLLTHSLNSSVQQGLHQSVSLPFGFQMLLARGDLLCMRLKGGEWGQTMRFGSSLTALPRAGCVPWPVVAVLFQMSNNYDCHLLRLVIAPSFQLRAGNSAASMSPGLLCFLLPVTLEIVPSQ